MVVVGLTLKEFPGAEIRMGDMVVFCNGCGCCIPLNEVSVKCDTCRISQ